jgi:poly(3-hydroxybutyrate) depolymerase
MLILLLLSVLLCSSAPPQSAAGAPTRTRTTARRAPAPPPRERAERAAPPVLEGGARSSRALVIALHGGSWKDPDPGRLAERCLDDLSDAARRAGLRLLVPVAPAPEAGGGREHVYQVPWLLPEGEALVLALIEGECAGRRADPARICLAGHGAGATGALVLAARHAGRIAGVAAWSGTPAPLWDEHRRVIGLVDDPVPALRDVPVYLWTARDDPWLDRAALGLFTRGLEAQRQAPAPGAARTADLLLVADETGGHGYGVAGPAAGLRFLKAQRRPQPP